MKTIATLCTGGGLFESGAGLAYLWGIESVPAIASVAEANGFGIIRAKIQDVDYTSLESPWWLHMSPPCINASQAKVDAGETELDIELAQACERAIKALLPPMVSLENVWPYRNFESFKLICKALRQAGYALDFWHLNSANYGVPQTRKRLFLVASRVKEPRKPIQTHQEWQEETGQLAFFDALPVWNGWYQAIEDLIPLLPDDEFAPWQEERLSDELKTMLVAGGYDGGIVTVQKEQPAFTVTANQNQTGLRALLVSDGGENGDLWRDVEEPAPCVTLQSKGRVKALLLSSANSSNGLGTRQSSDPAMTVTANMIEKGVCPRAFLLMTGNTQITKPTGTGIKQPDEPSNTVCSNSVQARAFIVDGQTNSDGESMTIRDGKEPFLTVSASQKKRALRAYAGGRVVRMTPRCLARFQSIPDEYLLPEKASLACTVIGNAVPPRMAEVLVKANL